MSLARIQNLHRRTNAAEREAFESSVFTTPTGTTRRGVLPSGDAVEILERRDRRPRVRAESGLEGWVNKGDVVKLRWVRRQNDRFTSELNQRRPARRSGSTCFGAIPFWS